MDKTTTQIAEFAATLSFDNLPVPTVNKAKQLLVDTLACALGGANSETVAMGKALCSSRPPGDFEGRFIGSARTTSADMATFVNTAMIRYLDFNDFFPGGHPSDCLGGLLAVAGTRNSTGEELLTAMLVTYEVYNRLSESAKFRHLGWDQGAAVAGALTAGLGNLTKMENDQIGHAVALATVSCVPLRATRAGQLSLWKGAATAHAARDAVFLTGLASRGMTGPVAAFEGRHGIWDMITGPFELRPFGPQGGDYLTNLVRPKYWPVEYNTQIAVWAARELRSQVSIDELTSVELGTYWSAWHETGSESEKWAPTTRETADHSLPYIFARSLVDGEINLTSFEPEAYLDPAIREVMKLVSVHEDKEIEEKYPEVIALRVHATKRDGTSIDLELENPRGHERNPMTADETSDKFRRMANRMEKSAIEDALSFWWALESHESISQGLDLLTSDL